MIEEPCFRHTCAACRFLGHYEGHDLYVCPNGWRGMPGTVVARFGNAFASYRSGALLASVDPVLAEALRRATEAGLWPPPAQEELPS